MMTNDEYNWMMEGMAKVGLCDGLLNSDFQYYLPYCPNFPTVQN
jgi:hypothetical protein